MDNGEGYLLWTGYAAGGTPLVASAGGLSCYKWFTLATLFSKIKKSYKYLHSKIHSHQTVIINAYGLFTCNARLKFQHRINGNGDVTCV